MTMTMTDYDSAYEINMCCGSHGRSIPNSLGHSTAKVVMKCKVFKESKEKPSCVRTTYST